MRTGDLAESRQRRLGSALELFESETPRRVAARGKVDVDRPEIAKRRMRLARAHGHDVETLDRLRERTHLRFEERLVVTEREVSGQIG